MSHKDRTEPNEQCSELLTDRCLNCNEPVVFFEDEGWRHYGAMGYYRTCNFHIGRRAESSLGDVPLREPRGVAEQIAEHFHAAYEYLAEGYGYVTRGDSAVPWEDVPEVNRSLMVHTVANLIAEGVIVPGRRYEQP